MARANIRMEEYDRLRNIEKNYKRSIAEIEKCADAKAREEFVTRVTKLAEENGRLREHVKKLEKDLETAIRRMADAFDAQKRAEKDAKVFLRRLEDAERHADSLKDSNVEAYNRSSELQNKLFKLYDRGLFARIFRRYE